MKWAVLAAVVLCGIGIVAAMQTGAQGGDGFLYRDAGIVARGQVLYRDHCASCHGTELEGQPNWRERDADGFLPAPPHDASGHTWHHPDAQLFEITKIGTAAYVGDVYKSNMPGFGETLQDADIRAILAFIKSTWPDRIIERHDRLNAAYDAAQRP